MENKRMSAIEELAEKYETHKIEVMEVYTRYNHKLYSRKLKENGRVSIYDDEIEDKTFELTERYLRINLERRVRDGLNK